MECSLWTPSLSRVLPPGAPKVSAGCYWLFHHSGVFYNRDLTYALLHSEDRTVHYSTAYPGYFRFPFMQPQDLQIGNLWTDPQRRGEGLATLGVRSLVEAVSRPGRAIWYVVHHENRASIGVVEKCGFQYYGRGVKQANPRTGMLPCYHITDRGPAPPELRAA